MRFQVGDCGRAATFPDLEDREHGGEGGGAQVAEGRDGGEVDGGWGGGRGEAGGKEAGVDGLRYECFEGGGGGEGEGGGEVGVG